MPRFIVPRSTRTTYGTTRPASVVVVARSAGAAAAGSYGLKQGLAGGVAGAGAVAAVGDTGGLGSGRAKLQPAAVVL